MKILNVVGARPNFVKIAPLLAEMRGRPGIEPLLVHTGQHSDSRMSASFFRDLEITAPDFHLAVSPCDPQRQTAEISRRIEPILRTVRPELVVVVGDVTSTLAAALTAARLGIPVAHVEAGLRSFDRSMPEELNRSLTDAVSSFLFASEPSAVRNLLREGRSANRIHLVGNVMIDTLKRSLPRARRACTLVKLGLAPAPGMPPSVPYAVLTLHRQGLVDRPVLLSRVWTAIEAVARQIPVVFPVHPRTQQRLSQARLAPPPGRRLANDGNGILLTPPLGYLEFLCLQTSAALVLTDSGGIQEETTALGVPCLTLRCSTERPITVSEGTNRLVGLDPDRIRTEAFQLLSGHRKPARAPALWDGQASRRIIQVLCRHFFSSIRSNADIYPPGNAASRAVL